MIFNSKQLEELENIHDSTGAFEEEGDEESGFDEVGEAAMDWRRGLIEEAAENIKRAKGRPVESQLTYPIGSMLFERDARRFARVQRSIPGYLKIVYLSGGDREFGTLDVQVYLREYGAEKRLSELSEQLGMADIDVAIQLERLGITPLEELDAPEEVVAVEEATLPPPPLPTRGKRPAAAVVVDDSDEDEDEDAVDEEEAVAVVAEPAAAKSKGRDTKLPMPAPVKGKVEAKVSKKPAAPEKAPVVAAAPEKPMSAKAVAAKAVRASKAEKPEKSDAKKGKGGKSINPIDDPNGYIKANFQEMSNRELARYTGLSEHTIRRKLGEWGLKRKPA
jgi:hypothetical protein